MLEFKNNLISAETLHSAIGTKTKFHPWIKRVISACVFCYSKDYEMEQEKTNGRPKTTYFLSRNAVLQACIFSDTEKSREIIAWLKNDPNKKAEEIFRNHHNEIIDFDSDIDEISILAARMGKITCDYLIQETSDPKFWEAVKSKI